MKTGLVDVLLVQNEESENEYPHITLSTADGVNPSASNNEIAKAISRGTVIPVQDCLRVTEGYFNGKTDVKK